MEDWPTISCSQSNKTLLSFQNTENTATDAILDFGGHLETNHPDQFLSTSANRQHSPSSVLKKGFFPSK